MRCEVTEDLSMSDILSYGAAEYVAEANADGIYGVLSSQESSFYIQNILVCLQSAASPSSVC